MKLLTSLIKKVFTRSIPLLAAIPGLLLWSASTSFSQATYDVGKYHLLVQNGSFYDVTTTDTFKVNTNHILIKLKTNLTENERLDFDSMYSISPNQTSTFQITLYDINPEVDFIELNENLASDPNVEFYDISHLCPLTDIQRPDDSFSMIEDELISHNNLLWPYKNTKLFEAWEIVTGDSNIIVADLDDGIWTNHPDLSNDNDGYSNLWKNPGEIPADDIDNDYNSKIDDVHGWNFPANNNELLLDIYPMESHGTRMSSIISAKTNNDEGIWGVAGGYSTEGSNVMMLNCRSLADPEYLDDAYFPLAIDYAVTMGARIINMPIEAPYNQSLESTIHDYYQLNDIIFLGSSGNNNVGVNYPAKYDGVMAIGASQSNADILNSPEYKWYSSPDDGSNYGMGLDFVAPGGLFVADVTGSSGNYYADYTFKTYWDFEQSVSTSRAVSFASGVVALVLSLYPCLHNDEVEELLVRSADKIGNYTYDGAGWCEEAGYGRINAFNVLKPPIDHISGSTTWDSDRRIIGDVIIENQGELIIENCIVSFGKLSKIIVKQGGILKIQNNAVLTSICEEMWPGIEVWGDRNASQYSPGAQGKLIINGGTIENALLAVDLWKPGTTSMTGGIIEAHDAVFQNNTKSVRAIYYRNFNPGYPNQELDYYGIFDDCSFILDANYLGKYLFEKHVDLAQVKGIKFYGCTFSLDHSAEFASHHSLGIAAYDAGFQVLPSCTTQVAPCPQIDSCRFNGFDCAIGCFNASMIHYPVLVNEAHFDDNVTGVFLSGTIFTVILENFIEVGYDFPYTGNCGFASGIGIDIHHTNGFVVENNKLRKNSLATNGIYAGIRVKDCPSEHDIIYKNELEGLSFGNYADGTNRQDQNISYTGVEYQCNSNSHNVTDFIVNDLQDPREAMIRGYHGSRDTASGNVFSRYLPSIMHFENWGNQIINFYYCDPCTDEEPINIYADPPELFEKIVSDEYNCPDHYGGEGHIQLTYGERLDKEETFAQNLNDYNSVNILYESLVDGGDTETELADIESAEPDDMWELRSQLLGHSPHLSQEVLRAMAERTDVFPDEVLLEILSANPDELNRDTLISYLEQKEDPLPDYMIDILRQAISGITYKTILENEMAQYHAAKTRSAQDIIRSILFDTIFNATDYRNWLDNMDNISADRQIISTYLSEDDTTSAITLLNLLPSLYGLDGEDLEDYNDYKSLIEMQISLEAEGKWMNEPDSSDILVLESIAQNDNSYAGNMARNILTYAGIHEYCFCLTFIDSSYMKNSFIPKTNTSPENNIISISAEPIPAHTFVSFNFKLQHEYSAGIITVSDVQGKVIWKTPVNGKIGQKVWNTELINAGIYYFNILSEGLSKAGKIVIY